MKVNSFSLCLLLWLGMLCLGCSSRQQKTIADTHTSQNSLDWEGTYQGMLPCADCEGIETTLQLFKNNTFQLDQYYNGKGVALPRISGRFAWRNNGNTILFAHQKEQYQFQVVENKLFWLNKEGQKITGPLANNYILTKQENNIKEKYWKLVTLMGDSVRVTGTREAHFILKADNKFIGHGGCNALNGNYILNADKNSLSFKNIITTEMACVAMATEQKLITALQTTNIFSVNGDKLVLYTDKKVPLATFEAVYL